MTAESTGRIRLGIIGTGLAVELLHWPALRRMPERYVVTAFADRSRSAAERFSSYAEVGMDRYSADYADLLAREDVDAVLICLPIPHLFGATRDALAAGKHVLCEKPTGTDEEQADAFLALADAHPDQVVLIGENLFYRDDVRFARSLVDDGAIGQIHLMSWRTVGQLRPKEGAFSGTRWRQRPEYRGGPHLDAGVHHLAQIRMVCGDAVRVHGVAGRANPTIEASSHLSMNLEFASGAVGNYTAGYLPISTPPEHNGLCVYGSDGVLLMRRGEEGREVVLWRPDGSSRTHRFTGIDNGYYAELRNFFDAVTHGAQVVGSVRQGYTTMLTILRGLDAAEKGEVMPVPRAQGAGGIQGAGGVPLWRPHGASGLFEGLPGEHVVT